MSSSNQVHIPIVFYTPFVSSIPKDSSHPPLLQVYSHHQTFHRPSNDSLLVLVPLLSLTPIIKPDLPIAICKGMHSTRNPSP